MDKPKRSTGKCWCKWCICMVAPQPTVPWPWDLSYQCPTNSRTLQKRSSSLKSAPRPEEWCRSTVELLPGKKSSGLANLLAEAWLRLQAPDAWFPCICSTSAQELAPHQYPTRASCLRELCSTAPAWGMSNSISAARPWGRPERKRCLTSSRQWLPSPRSSRSASGTRWTANLLRYPAVTKKTVKSFSDNYEGNTCECFAATKKQNGVGHRLKTSCME